MTLIPIDRKQNILEDAKERILKNHTLEQVAKSHGITKRTLNTWLMSLGDEYQELKEKFVLFNSKASRRVISMMAPFTRRYSQKDPAWESLEVHCATIRNLRLRQVFAHKSPLTNIAGAK